MIWLLAAAALAQDQQTSWQLLQDSLLVEALDGDLAAAGRQYDDLARHLGPDDPIHSEALYHLGRLAYAQGDVDQARAALRDCVRTGVGRGRCLALLGRIEVEQGAVHAVPVLWTFDDAHHGIVHPWPYSEHGIMRPATPTEGGAVLEWRTPDDPTRDDQLVVGFRDPTPPPKGIRFNLRSLTRAMRLRAQLYDVVGRRFTVDGGVSAVPHDRWTRIELDLDEAIPDDGGAPLVPAELDRLVLQDVTAFYGEGGGNTLWLDDLEVW